MKLNRPASACLCLAASLVLEGTAVRGADLTQQPGFVSSEFIADPPTTPASHASTLVETPRGLLAAWFGGTRERALDVGIWMARYLNGRWTQPVQVADGANAAEQVSYPCWNPVLFQPANGPLYLFYKVGPSPQSWWGMVMTSTDDGQTWTPPKRLPKDIFGPIRNKPVQLADGTLLCGSSTEDAGWRIHMEWTKNPLGSWERTRPLNNPMDLGAIQPTILPWPSGMIQILCRTKQGVIAEAWSSSQGRSWSRLVRTELPNPNSAIDAVLLADGRALLVYNHTARGRSPLNVAVSEGANLWKAALVLENEPGGEFSYPAVIQTSDGLVHVTYTWKRQRIKHVVLDPSRLQLRPIRDGQWP
jgi:predicted neuraminidase